MDRHGSPNTVVQEYIVGKLMKKKMVYIMAHFTRNYDKWNKTIHLILIVLIT